MNAIKWAGALMLGLILPAPAAEAQVYGTFTSANGPTAQWVLLGTLTLPEQGYNGLIRMYAGQGYNATNTQNGYVDLFIRTSNTLSGGIGGFCASGFASRFGEGGASFVQAITLVSDQAGCQPGSSTPPQYSVYVYLGQFAGSGFYSVEASSLGQTGGSLWAPSGIDATPPGCGATAGSCTASNSVYLVPFESVVNVPLGLATGAPCAHNDGIANCVMEADSGTIRLSQPDANIELVTGGGGQYNDAFGSRWRVHDTGSVVYTSFDTKYLGNWTNDRMTFSWGGQVGIGTTTPCANSGAPAKCLLAVNGGIEASEVVVTNGITADYVFAPGYRLAPLSEVAEYVKANRHLPEIPSAAEVAEKGVSPGEMQAKLLAKIEELTLHMIEAEQENRDLRRHNVDIRQKLAQLEAMIAGGAK